MRSATSAVRHSPFIGGLVIAATSLTAGQQRPATFELEETTIARIHAAMKAGTLTCRGLGARTAMPDFGEIEAGLQQLVATA